MLRLYSGFVRVVFPCAGLKGVQILAERPISLGGYKYWGGINIGGGIHFGGGGLCDCTRLRSNPHALLVSPVQQYLGGINLHDAFPSELGSSILGLGVNRAPPKKKFWVGSVPGAQFIAAPCKPTRTGPQHQAFFLRGAQGVTSLWYGGARRFTGPLGGGGGCMAAWEWEYGTDGDDGPKCAVVPQEMGWKGIAPVGCSDPKGEIPREGSVWDGLA